ncbi:hypothetical protein MARHY1042 [Marinobacter nauticus ATCC 49840]|nr:hypothetical protein MARHY1042 [Marinobacter nauticus ATCC 49840]
MRLNKRLSPRPDGVFRDGFQKISEAMDGRREALRDELVAVFWKPSLNMPCTIASTPPQPTSKGLLANTRNQTNRLTP